MQGEPTASKFSKRRRVSAVRIGENAEHDKNFIPVIVGRELSSNLSSCALATPRTLISRPVRASSYLYCSVQRHFAFQCPRVIANEP